jgi:hypothetical protein
VKRLLQIVLGAFVLFMVLAVGQEWRLFASAWLGGDGASEPSAPLTEAEGRAAADTVARTLALMRHFYLSGGDPRFAERMPASPGLIDELRADVDYLARNHRLQDPELQRLVVLSVDPAGPGGSASRDRLELRTREWWTFRTLWAADGSEAEPPRERVVDGLYYLVRTGAGWRVEGWRPIVFEDAGESGAEGPA